MGSDQLVGLDIGTILPPMRNRPVKDLFLPNLGTTQGTTSPLPKKGGLKVDKSERGRGGGGGGRRF